MNFDLKPILIVEEDEDAAKQLLEFFSQYQIRNEIILLNRKEQLLPFLQRREEYRLRKGENPLLLLLGVMEEDQEEELVKCVKSNREFQNMQIVLLRRTGTDEPTHTLTRADAVLGKPLRIFSFIELMQRLKMFQCMIQPAE